jgi:hypothetical protein
VHLAYERDMPLNEPPGLPLDQPRLVQSFVYLLGVWSFDLVHEAVKPLESRGQVVSP